MPEIIKSGGGVAGIEQRYAAIEPFAAVNTVLSYNYQSSNAPPTAGQANQSTNNLSQLVINNTGQAAQNNTAFFTALTAGTYLGINGIEFLITGVNVAGGVTTLVINPAKSAPPLGVTNLTFVSSPFPLFTPIVPPPVIGVGGGPPPTFPPPTPPPIGAIPPGVTVGPAIAPAGVPPSQAGFPLIQYKTGSATAPTAASWIPQFTTTFPAPTIVIGPFMNSGTGQSGKSPPFINTPPAQTASTAPITQSSTWAPQKPPWLFMAPEIAAAALAEDVRTTRWAPPPEEEEPPPTPKPRRGRR